MRQWSDDPIAELMPSRVGREFLWLCLIVWVLAWLAVIALTDSLDRVTSRARAFIRDRRHRSDGLDVRVLDTMRQNQRPNPAARTGTFLHRSSR